MTLSQTVYAPKIVYQDRYLICVYQPAPDMSRIGFTFSGMRNAPRPDYLWAGHLLHKLGIPAIGFVGQQNNWYPATSVHSAIAELDKLELPSDAFRFGYGQSMGGYGVMKFGAALRLDCALALSPQISIDQSDIEDKRAFTQNFDPVLNRGMRVQPGDGAKQSFLLFDPAHVLDARHAAMLRDTVPSTFVELPYVDHGVADALTSSTAMRGILDAMTQRDYVTMRRLILARRRLHPERPFHISMRLALKHPHWARKVFETYPEAFPRPSRHNFFMRLRRSGQDAYCIEQLTGLLAEFPQNHGILHVLGLFHLDIKDLDRAQDYIERAASLTDNPGIAHSVKQLQKHRAETAAQPGQTPSVHR